jgi:tetratricopeptide (TPR) repeat protein
MARENGDKQGEGSALHAGGQVSGKLGRPERAQEHYRQAIAVRTQAGDRREAESLLRLGDLLHDAGQPETAHLAWSQALTLCGDPADPMAAGLRGRMDGSRAPAATSLTGALVPIQASIADDARTSGPPLSSQR